MNSSAEQPCCVKASWIASFTRSEVSGSPSTLRPPLELSARRKRSGAASLPPPARRRPRPPPRLGAALRAPDPRELRRVLDASARVEERAVRRELDALRAEVLGEHER